MNDFVLSLPGRSLDEKEKFHAMLLEVNDHLSYVLKEKFNIHTLVAPEMTFGGGHVVIRFGPPDERWIFRVPRHSGLQLRRIMLAYDLLGDLDLLPDKIFHDGKCIVERNVPGRSLGPGVSSMAIRVLARKLARMHSLAALGYGPLDFGVQAAMSDASAYYSQRSPLVVDRAQEDLSSADEALLNLAIEEASTVPASVLTTPTVVTHGDLWRRNVLVSEHDAKVIDWDGIGAFPPEMDLAILIEAEFSAEQIQDFLHHYARPVSKPHLRWFSLRRTLRNKGLPVYKKLQHIRASMQFSDAPAA